MRIWAAALAPYGRHSGVTRAVSETPLPQLSNALPLSHVPGQGAFRTCKHLMEDCVGTTYL